PTTAVPNGVAMYDSTGDGLYADRIVVPSIWGQVWLYDIEGANALGTSALFQFSEDFHSVGGTPTVYADLTTGELHAAFTSGGYTDQLAPLGIDTVWSPQTEEQWLIAVNLDPATRPMKENVAGNYGGDLVLKVNLGNGERGFSQAIVTGDDILVVTDSTDVNRSTYGSSPGTGAVRRYNLTDHTQVGNTEDITGGASSVEITGDKENVVIGSGQDARRMDVQDQFGEEIGTGRTIEQTSGGSGTTRLLWLGG
ncbi:MAG TPA: hypothetical protein VMZ28_10450, partial [Kofleriaceae bacterium]|nr:hypothetical protein [Kofleriaceae bacterium]